MDIKFSSKSMEFLLNFDLKNESFSIYSFLRIFKGFYYDILYTIKRTSVIFLIQIRVKMYFIAIVIIKSIEFLEENCCYLMI